MTRDTEPEVDEAQLEREALRMFLDAVDSRGGAATRAERSDFYDELRKLVPSIRKLAEENDELKADMEDCDIVGHAWDCFPRKGYKECWRCSRVESMD